MPQAVEQDLVGHHHHLLLVQLHLPILLLPKVHPHAADVPSSFQPSVLPQHAGLLHETLAENLSNGQQSGS